MMRAIHHQWAAVPLAVSLGCVACQDVNWPSERIIDSLRVLGVQAEPASIGPGKSTRLTPYCVDGSAGPGAEPSCDVEVAWFAQCNNPDKDVPTNCFEGYASWVDKLAAPIADSSAQSYPDGFGFGPSFDFTAPDDILTQEVRLGPHELHFGTSYVYFIVCAGKLYPVAGASDRLPVECRDRVSGKPLDQRRFVVGVTTVYSYDLISSRNPELTAPWFDSTPIPTSCASAVDCPANFECSSDGACIPVVATCSKSQPEACRPHSLAFEVSPTSFALFTAEAQMLESPLKSVWIDYYTNAGYVDEDAHFGIEAPTDPSSSTRFGWRAWQAPPIPTEHAHLWVVVRDNRGGLALWDQRIIVR